ncbi:helicase associated domain-containing protein [Streptomyces sp. V2I9]|uniref:helicase associated domain-containing protein n=1 Tax=Streptomyces sp. V2I9 TaxID=3042304 RepID=UPI002786E1F0|nr:helicase associated domain-containing protein [Streptomyces sp. V2I9]MDQ0988696.1 hypothetical protein [Streptomyces sp. V2I9]
MWWGGRRAGHGAGYKQHGHLAIPTTGPSGQFLIDQRAAARKGRLAPDREAQLTALDPDWLLPHGADWHRKYHTLRRHIEAGHDLATLRRDTVIDGMNIGSWLQRQLTTFTTLKPTQRALLLQIGADPARLRLSAGMHARRSFEQNTELLRAFIERHNRTPGAREWIEADGARVEIGA